MADKLSGAGITREAPSLGLVAVIGSGVVADVAVREVRRRHRPGVPTEVECGAHAETIVRADDDKSEDHRSL